jgi:hypothetical protein
MSDDAYRSAWAGADTSGWAIGFILFAAITSPRRRHAGTGLTEGGDGRQAP